MKKSLYVSIALGVAALSLGVQVSHVNTVWAAETTNEENVKTSTDTSKEEKTSQEQPAVTEVTDNNESEETTDLTKIDNPETVTEPKADDIKSDEPTESTEPTEPVTPVEPETNKTWIHSDDLDEESRNVASGFTEQLWSKWGNIKYNLPKTPKNDKLIDMLNAAIDFVKIQDDSGNILYRDRAQLDDFITNFNAAFDLESSYGDDDQPVKPVKPVKPVEPAKPVVVNHSSSSRKITTESVNVVDMTVTTIKQVLLYNENGKAVSNRGLSKNSLWHVTKSKMINNQKMYYISNDEWVAAADVQ